MDKNVLIHVRGLQMMEVGEEQEPIELVVPGQYYLHKNVPPGHGSQETGAG